MAEKSYFRLQLDSTIRETEKLLKMLRTLVRVGIWKTPYSCLLPQQRSQKVSP